MARRRDDESAFHFLEAVDRLHAETKPPSAERAAPATAPPMRLAFVFEPTAQEREMLTQLSEHLGNTLASEPNLLVTRRDDALVVHAWTHAGTSLDQMRLETRLRSYQEGVLDVKHPFHAVVFDVNGRTLDTRELRHLKPIELDLTKELFREPSRERER